MISKEKIYEIEKDCKGVIELFDKKRDLFEKKNSNYGAAWRKIGPIIDYITEGKSVKLETDIDHCIYQLYGRMLEKMIRFCNIRFCGQVDNVNEKADETMSDISVQALMVAQLSQKKEKY